MMAAAPGAACPLVVAAADAGQSVAQLAQQLNDRATPADTRFEVAERLSSMTSPEARKALADALVNSDESPRLAAARSLADDAQPAPELIDPLFVALGTSKQSTAEAVSRALARFSDDGSVLTRLIGIVNRVPANPISRREIVRVLGTFVEKRSAALLIQILQDPNESPPLKSAASDALAEMTAAQPGSTPDWTIWWQQHQNQRDADFRAGLLAVRSSQLDLLRLRDNQIVGELSTVLREQYFAFPATSRADVLLRYLRSPEPAIRATGTGIATEEARLDVTLPTAVRDQLRLMISDSDPDVRAQVATAIAKINDPTALSQLQNQLREEPSPKVREALARALGTINDASAVPQLLDLLNDASPAVVQAAAYALNDQLAAKIQKENPPLASHAADVLQAAFNRLPATPGNEEVRQSLLAPMAPLQQDKLLPLLNSLLSQQRGESAGIKRLALNAIGDVGNAQSAGAIASQLNDPDRSVRLAAVRALGKNPSARNFAWQLMQRVDPQVEGDSAVQTSAWDAVSSLLPSLPVQQLQQFFNQLAGQPDRRLLVLQAEQQQLIDQNNQSDLAGVRENIGTAMVELGRFAEAADYFKLSLDYKRAQNLPPAAIDQLISERMGALLRAKQYKDAIGFANETDKDSRYVPTMGIQIVQYAQSLINPPPPQQPDLDSVKQLISETQNMNPPLAGGLRDELQNISNEVSRRLANKSAGPSGQNETDGKTAPIDGSGTADSRVRSLGQ